jgi:hypothetical protein
VNNNNETIYIGSTTIKLSQKLAEMKYNYKIKKSCAAYEKIFEKEDYKSLKIVLVENYPCDNSDQLQARQKAIEERRTDDKYDTEKQQLIKYMEDLLLLLKT